MIIIEKSEVMRRVELMSAAGHYYSHPGSDKRAADVKRTPLVRGGRRELLSGWIDESVNYVFQRLRGWSLDQERGPGVSILTLQGRYERLGGEVSELMYELIVWRVLMYVMASGSLAEGACILTRCERAEDRLLSIFMTAR